MYQLTDSRDVQTQEPMAALPPAKTGHRMPVRWRRPGPGELLEEYAELSGMELLEQVLEQLDCSYLVSNRERERIPASGRVVLIANPGLGLLGALLLLRLVGDLRRDVRLVADQELWSYAGLRPLLLPLCAAEAGVRRAQRQALRQALEAEQALIIIPARLARRQRDRRSGGGSDWDNSFLKLTRLTNAPLVPLFIGRPRRTWGGLVERLPGSLQDRFTRLQTWRQAGRRVELRVGELIATDTLANLPLRSKTKSALLRKHLKRIGLGKPGIIIGERPIAHPQPSRELHAELRQAEALGTTRDGKQILLFDYFPNSSTIKEIGRLREESFRQVGEGSGRRRDLDRFDQHYRHLVLWDEERLEIVGAYRLGEAAHLTDDGNLARLYSASLFELPPALRERLPCAVELGRSFVQPAFWGTRALDYLWQGLGAYLRRHPQVRFLFGPVSISGSYPEAAKALLVWFYGHYFGNPAQAATPRLPFLLSRQQLDWCHRLFSGNDPEQDFRTLKSTLGQYGVSVPTLYKQYTELCEPGGVQILGFNRDPDFQNCIDALILVDLSLLKRQKYQRYVLGGEPHAPGEPQISPP